MESKPHFVLVPLLAQGHIIPMLDMAHLLAERGARVSYITTAVNTARIKTTVDRIKESGLPIHFVEFQLPCAKAGLPEGCENFDLLPSIDFFKPMMIATGMLGEPLELYLRTQHSPPACIITDFCNPSETTEAARELRIPRVVFHTTSCFFPLCAHLIYRHKIFDRITDEYETFLVPDFPGQQAIEVNKVQAPGFFGGLAWEDLLESALKAEATAEGLVINSFDELEPSYIQRYEMMLGKKVWTIGPLCLYNRDIDNKATRGKNSSVDNRKILTWLDSKEEMSVIYISFGSYALAGPSQLIEIGSALEASNKPFIWVIRGTERSIPEVGKWLREFEERTSLRGIIIRGWAPQMVILSHPAVGGFLTHCGWNSTLEAVAAGVPMLTWPRVADQFLNEKLVVQVLRTGVSVGVKVPSSYLAEDSDVVVKRGDIEKAVWNLMDGGEEGEERRKRAKELGEKSRRAMDEEGSSYMNMTHLAQIIDIFIPLCFPFPFPFTLT